MEQLRNNSVFQGTSLQKEGQFLLSDPRNVKKADPQAGKSSQPCFWQLVKGVSRLNMWSSTRLLTKPARPAHLGSPCKAYLLYFDCQVLRDLLPRVWQGQLGPPLPSILDRLSGPLQSFGEGWGHPAFSEKFRAVSSWVNAHLFSCDFSTIGSNMASICQPPTVCWAPGWVRGGQWAHHSWLWGSFKVCWWLHDLAGREQGGQQSKTSSKENPAYLFLKVAI